MEPILTGVAANLSSEARKSIFQEVKRHIRYVMIYKKNVDKFEEKLEMLIAKRTSVQQEVDAAKRNVQKIKADVEEWCNRVDGKIDEEKKKVKDLQDRAINKCFIGLCPSIKSRYQLSKRSEEGATTFQELITEGGQLTTPVGHWDVPQDIEDEPPKDFEAFESRQKVFNDTMEAVKDNTSISMIGVYGMGGVGKSTLLKEVVRQAKKAKLFDWVVLCVVNQTPDIREIQNQIADSLGLRFEEQSIPGRACRLRERFKEEKKFLLVLDDLWSKLDFTEVGIPSGDELKRCKILLASRSQNVLLQFDGMHARNTFPIGLLNHKESWDLFKKMAGEDIQISSSSELQIVGNEIAKRCGGLPIAISAIARTLRNKDPSAWRDASRQLLQRSSSRGLKEISPAVYSAIKLSYNHIDGEKLKQFFLFCNLLSHDTLIQDLLKYTIGLGLLPGGYTMEEARDTLLTWVSKLKASGLLLDSYNNERFDMHDIICNVALSIAYTKNSCVLTLKQEDVLKDWPTETMKQHSWINLRVDGNTVLPDQVECPQLTFLHISSEDCSTKVPPEFFKEMKRLKVLDLTDMDLSSFPSSIGLLSSLQTLCLDESNLGDITVVGELKALEVLSLWNTDIEKLSMEIAQLVKLRLLDLRGCTKLKVIPPGLLSKLTKLEELYMGRSFAEWEVEGDASQRSNASLTELSSLSHLTTLEVHIRDAKIVLGDFSFFRRLKRYKIFIGGWWGWSDDYEYSRTLKLQLNNQLHRGIKMLFEGTEDLYLYELNGVKIALHELKDEEGLPILKNLHIQNGSEIQYIIRDDNAAERDEFLINLRSLTLEDLPKLISICSGSENDSTSKHQCLPLFCEKMVFRCLEKLQISRINVERIWDDKLSDCNQKLTRLIIKGCDKLKHLLSASMARCLVHLNYFVVEGCKSLREIISTEDTVKGDKTPILFPQIHSLEMMDLQHLIGFCSGNYNIDFVSLKLLKIDKCPEFKGFIYNCAVDEENYSPLSSHALFNKEVLCPKLEKLQLNTTGVQRLWHEQLGELPSYTQNLTSLTLKGCPNLRCLFSSLMTQCFMQLQNLEIDDCGNVEEVIFVEGVAEEDMMTQLFPKLESLLLKSLSKLKRFYCGNHFKSFSLKTLCIESCPSLKTFISDSIMGNETQEAEENNSKIDFPPLFNEKVALPVLENLTIGGVMNLKKIWDDQQAAGSFCNLEYLVVRECRNLSSIFPFNMLRRLQKLKNLEIERCDSLEEIFEPQGINAIESNVVETVPKFKFPQVTYLKLDTLPKLKSLYCKMHTTIWPSLEKLWVSQCPNVEIIFANISEYHQNLQNMHGEGDQQRQLDIQPLFWTTKDTFPCLRKLRLESHDILREIWLGHLPSVELQRLWHDSCDHFLSLKKLEVKRCNLLNYVFPLSVAKNFVHLESLIISDCDNVKEVIGMDKSVEVIKIKVFPRLEKMELNSLPKLVRFCYGDYIEFPMLRKLRMYWCLKFTTFVSKFMIGDEPQVDPNILRNNSNVDDDLCLFNDKVAFPMLQKLQLNFIGDDKWMNIWHDKLTSNSFGELKYLELEFCSVWSIFPFSIVDRLKKLETMDISYCSKLESIIEPCRLDQSNESSTKFVFPQVSYLRLDSLRKLKSFYPRMHITQWPSLKELRVTKCNNVKIFTLNNLINSQLEIPADEQPLFWFSEDAFPCLEELYTDQDDAEEIFELAKYQESTIN